MTLPYNSTEYLIEITLNNDTHESTMIRASSYNGATRIANAFVASVERNAKRQGASIVNVSIKVS